MKSLFCAFLFFVSLYAVAQNNNVHYLIVNAKDGSKTTFALSNAPVVSCKDGVLSIASNSNLFTLNLDNIHNFTFEQEATAIAEVVCKGKVKLEKDHVLFGSLVPGCKVLAYLQDGQLVKECVADDNGNAIVNLGDMPKGIIILQSNIENIKIINR